MPKYASARPNGQVQSSRPQDQTFIKLLDHIADLFPKNPAFVRVFAAILWHCREKDRCRARWQTLAKKARCSRITVYRAQKAFVKEGLLQVLEVRPNGERQASWYVLLPFPIESANEQPTSEILNKSIVLDDTTPYHQDTCINRVSEKEVRTGTSKQSTKQSSGATAPSAPRPSTTPPPRAVTPQTPDLKIIKDEQYTVESEYQPDGSAIDTLKATPKAQAEESGERILTRNKKGLALIAFLKNKKAGVGWVMFRRRNKDNYDLLCRAVQGLGLDRVWEMAREADKKNEDNDERANAGGLFTWLLAQEGYELKKGRMKQKALSEIDKVKQDASQVCGDMLTKYPVCNCGTKRVKAEAPIESKGKTVWIDRAACPSCQNEDRELRFSEKDQTRFPRPSKSKKGIDWGFGRSL